MALLVFLPRAAAAQGVTTGAIAGRVTGRDGAALEGALVEVVHAATGLRLQAQARGEGRYVLQHVPPGGPYTVTARAIGFEATGQADVRVGLGQRTLVDLALAPLALELAEITVRGAANPLMDPARTGAAHTIDAEAITTLPLLGRNVTDLLVTAPQVAATPSGGPSIGAQNNRLNNIQIDGAVNNDLFGLGSTGTPGGQVAARPISLEAVQEVQVLTAPFDVQQGSFAGGLVNAVTRSGTNDFHGSVFGYLQGDAFVGDLQGAESGEFRTTQFGGTVAGPVVRDRLHYFAAVDLQASDRPFDGPQVGELGPSDTGVPADQGCARTVDALAALGYDAGGCGGLQLERPNPTVFARLDWQAGVNSRVTLSYNHVSGSADGIFRSGNGDWQLTGGGVTDESRSHTVRGNWVSAPGAGLANDLIVGFTRIRDRRDPATGFATVRVDQGAGTLVTGADRFAQANALDQDILELTDNLSLALGGRHQLTVGTHNEFFGFTNTFLDRAIGEWSFDAVEALEAGTASRFDRQLELRPGGGTAEFAVHQFGLYAQDRFQVSDRLVLTAGLRYDVPVFPDAPVTNDSLLDRSPLGIDTGRFPSGNGLWSPRVGFNLDVLGDGRTRLRGGVGLFTGRPAYVWMANAYSGTGTERGTLTCTAAAMNLPAFTLDPDAQPDACAGGSGPSQPTSDITVFDEDFRFQQNLKLALGVDQVLPWGMVGSADLVFTRWTNQAYIDDVNLTGPVGQALGEGGRLLYGTHAASGVATPSRVDPAYIQVLRHSNRSEDRSVQATLQVQKRVAAQLELGAAYTWSAARDLMSFSSSAALSNYGFTSLEGTVADRALTTSNFDRPHKVTLSGTVHLPARFAVSFIYTGTSGAPYGYIVQGDANADGIGGGRQRNDLVYVPRSASDVTLEDPAAWDDLAGFIESEDCLRSQRGRVMARNSCRNPWIDLLNARLAWTTPRLASLGAVELTMDVFNLPSLLNDDWGQVRETSGFEGLEMLRLVGWDQANQRGVYRLILPTRNRTLDASRWRVQWGGRLAW